jgi:hypothetical protein
MNHKLWDIWEEQPETARPWRCQSVNFVATFISEIDAEIWRDSVVKYRKDKGTKP